MSTPSPNSPESVEGMDSDAAVTAHTVEMEIEVDVVDTVDVVHVDDEKMYEEPIPIPAPATKGFEGTTTHYTEPSTEPIAMPAPVVTAHYAQPSTEPMNDGLTVNAVHVAAASSVSNNDFEANYDSMYDQGTGKTAGY